MSSNLWFCINVGISVRESCVGDDGLTPVQREIRDRCGNVPKRIRRSIDAYRVARGMVPLWGDEPALKSTGDWWRDATRRRNDRQRQQRRRARLRSRFNGR